MESLNLILFLIGSLVFFSLGLTMGYYIYSPNQSKPKPSQLLKSVIQRSQPQPLAIPRLNADQMANKGSKKEQEEKEMEALFDELGIKGKSDGKNIDYGKVTV